MIVEKAITPHFIKYVFDWSHEQYLLIGGYGSSKSYQTATKLILKCLQETRKVLVVRDVYESMRESCFDLFVEILTDMHLLASADNKVDRLTKVQSKTTPLELKFPNGSRIIFKGLDNVDKVRSINGVSIVWVEEASEIKYDAYKELLGRIRSPKESLHFILCCNPVGRDNWVYEHFFRSMDADGNVTVKVDEEEFYKKRILVRDGILYHHSTADDNPFLPRQYIKRLDAIKEYDPFLYRVARFGRFGAYGTRVLPQFQVAQDADAFRAAVQSIPYNRHFFGFDFGFEESFNAVLSMAVDDTNSILYIYDEIYQNGVTDDKFAKHPKMIKLKKKQKAILENTRLKRPLCADSEDPKAIQYYRSKEFIIRKTFAKFNGSKLSNTRKVKRFAKIICSPRCQNTIRELQDLTYKKTPQGLIKYDEFNIDAHTMSAIWYGLDTVNVSSLKDIKYNSRSGNTAPTFSFNRDQAV